MEFSTAFGPNARLELEQKVRDEVVTYRRISENAEIAQYLFHEPR